MYIDLIVLVLLILVVIMFFKNYQSFVFLMAIIDIFLRILSFIKNNIGLNDVSYIIGKYFPDSIFDIINTYTNGIGIYEFTIPFTVELNTVTSEETAEWKSE